MNTRKRALYMTRGTFLKTLSEAESTLVRSAESAERLGVGEEYLDLMRLQHGVQKSGTTTMMLGRVLPKSALEVATWRKLVSRLSS